MTNPKEEPKEISAEQKAKDEEKAIEAHHRQAEETWNKKSQKQKIDSLAAGFTKLFEGMDRVMEGEEILSNLNAANHFTGLAIIEALKLDKDVIVKRANEMFAADVTEQQKKEEEFQKEEKTKSKKNDVSVPDQIPEA